MADTTQYFVSHCVMHGGGTNRFGHSYLLISQYNPAMPNAEVEVTHAVGFNPTKLDNGTVEWWGKGHLINEALRDIINLDADRIQRGLTPRHMTQQHKTWEVSKTELDTLIANIIKDRKDPRHPNDLPNRDWAKEYTKQIHLHELSEETKKVEQQIKTAASPEGKLALEEKKTALTNEKNKQTNKTDARNNAMCAGADFDIRNHSCKTDALNRLEAIGIKDAANLHNAFFADIPMYSGRMANLELNFDPTSQKIRWKSPLELAPRDGLENCNEDEKSRILAQREFALLKEGVEEVYKLFDKKLKDLNSRNKVIQPITDGHTAIKSLLDNMNDNSARPYSVRNALNRQRWMKDFKKAVHDCKTELQQQNDDPEIVQFLRELASIVMDIFRRIASIFVKVKEVTPNAFRVADKAEACVEEIEEKMERLKVTP